MAGSTSSAGNTPPPPRPATLATTTVASPPAPKEEDEQQKEKEDGVLPLYTFTPAMFVEAEEDFALPPPPLPSDVTSRLQQTTAETDSHAKAVQANMWRMIAREKDRLYQELKQRLGSLPPDQQKASFASERLSTVTSQGLEAVLENAQAPGYLFDHPLSLSRPSAELGLSAGEEAYRAQLALQEEVQKFHYLREDHNHNHHNQNNKNHDPSLSRPSPSGGGGGGGPSKFEVGLVTRQHLVMRHLEPKRTPPREYVKVRSLDVVLLALQNLEGYAEQIPKMHEVRRRDAANEIGRNLSALAAATTTTTTTTTAAAAAAAETGTSTTTTTMTTAGEMTGDAGAAATAASIDGGDPMDIDHN